MKSLLFILFLFTLFTLFSLFSTLLSLLFRSSFNQLRKIKEWKYNTKPSHHREEYKINFLQIICKMRIEYKISTRQEQNRQKFYNNIANILKHIKFEPIQFQFPPRFQHPFDKLPQQYRNTIVDESNNKHNKRIESKIKKIVRNSNLAISHSRSLVIKVG